jgi:hypothetical protein
MKKAIFNMLFGPFFMLLLISSCKNATKTETTVSDSGNTEAATEIAKQGQAFIEDDVSTPNVLQIAILPLARPVNEQEGWTAVWLDGGGVGYVASEYVRSPIDYRAIFRFENRQWRLVTLLAGD